MMKKKMIRKLFALALVLTMTLIASGAVAEATADANETSRANAIAAMQVSLPDAQLNYAVRERDDGRYEWNLFFTQNDSLGVCKVIEKTNEVRRVELFKKEAGALTADQAMDKLAKEKGQLTILDLELDWDDGYLSYEGEAEMNGKRYEFEMDVDGQIYEWERD